MTYVRRTQSHSRRFEHVRIAERALGRPLPPGAVVHHLNLDGLDNRPENLVICPSQKYHALLHIRTNALAAGGGADWRKCWICGVHSPPDQLQIYPNRVIQHQSCAATYQRATAQRRKANGR
jgi:hypothetical protein